MNARAVAPAAVGVAANTAALVGVAPAATHPAVRRHIALYDHERCEPPPDAPRVAYGADSQHRETVR